MAFPASFNGEPVDLFDLLTVWRKPAGGPYESFERAGDFLDPFTAQGYIQIQSARLFEHQLVPAFTVAQGALIRTPLPREARLPLSELEAITRRLGFDFHDMHALSKAGCFTLRYAVSCQFMYPDRAQRAFRRAEKLFRRVIDSCPFDWYAWYGRGYALAALGREQEGIDAIAKAASLRPDKQMITDDLITLRRDPPTVAPTAKSLQDRPLDLSPFRTEGEGGKRNQVFNGSIASWQGRTWLAVRICERRVSRIGLVELGEDWQPKGTPILLNLDSLPESKAAQEDPRLFVHAGKLHVAFCGAHRRALAFTSMCLARLDKDLNVEKVWCPRLADAQANEKNWSFFEQAGELFAVYSIQPHRVLRIGETAEEFATVEDDWFKARMMEAEHGHLRGGASPVLHNGEYWSFFHGKTENPPLWNVGLYTFEARPPFRIRRFLPKPLLMPDPADRSSIMLPVCYFPCGAILRDGRWFVSYGAWDTEVRLASWDAAELDSLLGSV